MRPLVRQLAFCHEVLSGKWVMSGLYINQIPRMLYGVFEYYLLLEVGLVQMLIVSAPNPSKVIDEIIKLFEVDPWIKKLHS
jgi:hypothetical protein